MRGLYLAILFVTALAALLVLPSDLAFAQEAPQLAADSDETPTSIQITSILANLVIRLAAIAAGLTVVWIGHQSLLSGIKGDFEFDGKYAKLKGSSPGLLFVLLGCLAIGWALQAKHSGGRSTKTTETMEAGSESPQIPPIPIESVSPPIPPIPIEPDPT